MSNYLPISLADAEAAMTSNIAECMENLRLIDTQGAWRNGKERCESHVPGERDYQRRRVQAEMQHWHRYRDYCRKLRQRFPEMDNLPFGLVVEKANAKWYPAPKDVTPPKPNPIPPPPDDESVPF